MRSSLSSEMLVTDVSGQSVDSISMGQAVQEGALKMGTKRW